MRIIQDSEDEDDLELDNVAPAVLIGKDAPPQHVDLSPQPRESGIRSPGSLKRTIEAAHRAHFQSPPRAPSDQPQQQRAPVSSNLLSEHTNKRRKTALDEPSVKSPAMSSARKKAPVTYGQSKTLFNSPTMEQRLGGSSSKQTVTTVEKIWDLPGIMRDEWQHHEPMGLFPDPSSTVPNATATQQQLLDEVLAPAFLGIEAESDAPRYVPAKSSVPWSEFLKSSTRDTQEQPDPMNQTSQSSDQHQSSDSQSGPGDLTLESIPSPTRTPRLSQRNRRGSSVRLKGSPLHDEVLQNNVDPKELMGPHIAANLGVRNGVAQHSNPTPSRTNRGAATSQPASAELRRSPGRRQKSQEGGIIVESSSQHQEKQEEGIVLSPHVKAKQKSGSVPNSEDDLMAIGLPKEQYRPRPSRSRSLKLAAETPIDYSMRPEKAAKKPRRSRTSGGGEGASSASTPEKVQQICAMGFTPSTTQRALRQNNGDITSTVDWLVANGVAEDELAPVRPSKSKSQQKAKDQQDASSNTESPIKDTSTSNKQDRRGSISDLVGGDAASIVNTDQTSIEVPEDEPIVVPPKSPRVKVLIPKSKGQNTSPKLDLTHEVAPAPQKHSLLETPGRKAKRRKTSMDQPEPPLEDIVAVAIETPKEKKRGRGRPRKESKLTESISEEQHEDLQVDTARVTGTVPQVLRQQPSGCTTNNIIKETIQAPTPAPARSVPTSTPPPKNMPAAASQAPSRTPEKPLKAAASSKSPLSKGKVTYRVGLSKRARIAPLLRTLKK